MTFDHVLAAVAVASLLFALFVTRTAAMFVIAAHDERDEANARLHSMIEMLRDRSGGAS